MKKLGKLSIKPEKVIKNEELVNLRGGYGGSGTCAAWCAMPDGGWECNISYDYAQQLVSDCQFAGGTAHWCCDSCSSSSWYSTVC